MPQHEQTGLDFEYRLTLAFRMSRGCACGPYFRDRGAVLLPEVAKHAKANGLDVVDEFARYARGVHARHEAGLSLAVSA